MPHEIYGRSYEFSLLCIPEEDKTSPDFKDSDTLAAQLRAMGEAAEALSNFEKLGCFNKAYWDSLSETELKALVPSDADFSQIPPDGGGSVVHNYQHDLESLWWVTLWFITLRVDYKAPANFASNMFCGTSFSAARADLFLWGCHPSRGTV